MAFTATAVWEVQTGGDDTNNGGGFDTGVSGFPTDGTVDTNTGDTASPVFSSASYNFVAGDVGASIYIKSGTDSIPGWYPIVSVASNKATLDAAIGAAAVRYHSGATVPTLVAPNTAIGLATVGTPTSLTWGIDYSQQAAPEISFTDLVIGGTTTQFTSAANPVGKNFVGNTISITAGTGFTVQRVAVVSTSGTTATCDKSLGTGGSTGGTGGFGGCLASVGLAGSVLVNSNVISVKTGSYSITSATVNIAGGCLSGQARIVGYATVRGDNGTAPTLTASGITTATIVNLTGNAGLTQNVAIDGATLTSIRGLQVGNGTAYLVWVKNCTNSGIYLSTRSVAYRCRASGCITTFAAFECRGADLFACEAYDNTIAGFGVNVGGNNLSNCLSYGNTGATTDGFSFSAGVALLNCVSYGNGRDGFRVSGNAGIIIVNCIAEGNSAYGFNLSSATTPVILTNCATYNNTSGSASLPTTASPLIIPVAVAALSGSPFTNAAADDFSLNNTAGAGASCRAAGFPGTFASGSTTGYLDIGAVQHADPAASVSASLGWAPVATIIHRAVASGFTPGRG